MIYLKSKKDIHSGYGRILKGTILSKELWNKIVGNINSLDSNEYFELTINS